jgi:ectoine hydroxylase-related dioxygenase (phytanoyl-CoA dioxygenase family)
MPQLTTLDLHAPTQAVLDALDADGAVILRDTMSDALAERAERELRPHIERSANGIDPFSGFSTTRTGALVARSPACRELVLDPRIRGVAHAFLSPLCERYQLHLTQAIRLLPGQGAQLLHRDRLAWGPFLPKTMEPQLNTIWALTDFTAENGATQVVPGSHRWDWSRTAEAHEITQAVMPKGSVLLYTGSVIHGGGQNRSDGERIGINITYCLGWLRQEENQYLSCPPEVARTLSPELQELLGYSMGSYALGYFSMAEPPKGMPDTLPPEMALGRLPGTAPSYGAVASGFVPTART